MHHRDPVRSRANARLLLAPLVAAIALAGCGSSNSALSGVPVPSSLAQVSSPTGATGAAGATGPPGASTSTAIPPVPADISHKPKVVPPKGPAPKTLVVKDLVVGKGPAAKAGDKLTVQYVGVLYNGGKQFDASWDRHMPFPLTLGQGQVIPGWDKGLVGMRLHGRRELIIPAKLAYGSTSRPGIPANSPLVFVIDLLKIG